ncbi:hypothetical protein AVEN_73021-1 [Araneus ventricosus]|uniref:Uncharacterized protein n=1 Tax=Araneus ventricosus TaxID=182803 RepID=A0A4Y2PLY4_ARAVE|nr:hypothetical protein AVEN_73021-1 [Araneus ventricosus]
MQNSRGLVFWTQQNAAHEDPAHVPCSGTWSLMKSFRKAGSQESPFRQSHMTIFFLARSFHLCITGMKVLDQVALYQLSATDVTRQLLLASLVGISKV